ncbi:MAG TPA: hypothetical protein PK797_11060 [Burkholderiaceae bacterium]|jgi:predicted flap endonuclease-1-like 5' DNA nuclease|nr:hypothetical protein [Burkholderiaceae bacterium]
MYLLSQIWLHLLMACVAGAGLGAGLRWFCVRRSQARAMEQARADADAHRLREVQALQASHAQELSSMQERHSVAEVQSSQDLAQRDAELADLRELHGALSQEAAGHLERAQEQRSAWVQERESLNGRLQEARQAVQQVQAVQTERDELQQQVHALALRVDETLRIGQEAQATVLAQQRAVHEAAWSQSEATLAERDQRLAEQAVELSSQMRRQTAMAAELDSLRWRLAQQTDAEQQLKAGAQREVEAAAQREQGLSSELQALRHSLEANDEQLALQAARLQQEQARQSSLEATLADCRQARSLLEEQAGRLRSEADALRAQVMQLRDAEARAQAQLAEAQSARPAVSPLATLSAEALEPLVMAAGAGLPPPGRAQPVDGVLDDLKIIVGIGPVNETWLRQQGIWTFAQIASWNAAELAWIAHHLPNFGSRVYRENWVTQAARLAAGEPVETAARH